MTYDILLSFIVFVLYHRKQPQQVMFLSYGQKPFRNFAVFIKPELIYQFIWGTEQ